MAVSLYSAFIPSALQMIGSTRQLVDTAEQWAEENDRQGRDIIEARLIEDMAPFSYQVKSVAVHTAGALASLEEGVFQPDMTPPPTSFDGLRKALDEAKAAIESYSVDQIEAYVGKDMRFELKSFRLDFLAEDFLLSFSQPNYYFHATTAYNLLRQMGAPIGKRNFLGQMRVTSG